MEKFLKCFPCSTALAGKLLDVLLAILVLVGLLLSYIGLITPRGAGFYCDDRTITHTYTGDTISVPMLFLGTLLAPVFFIFPVEFAKKFRKDQDAPLRPYIVRIWGNTWIVWRAELLGALIVLVLTEFTKGLVSEPRPHFWDTCKPNVTREMCDEGYISVFTCTSGSSQRAIADSQKSFPSGHTALSVYTCLFMIWYLGRSLHWSESLLVKPSLQVLWACFAGLCSLTRITDRRHHWWDVLAGAGLGVSVALFLIQALSRSIPWDTTDPIDDLVETSTTKDSPTPNILRTSSSKRLSVRRLLSTSSTTTTMVPEGELNNVSSN